MEFKESKIKPASTRAVLRQQVESQSDLCDFTVSKGQWSRRYHRCVLVCSEFFSCLLDQDFQEKKTGSVEIAVGSSSTVEAAIMFLYGKCPSIGINNIEHLLDLADFLLIPNLKALCVQWFKTVNITQENIVKFLHLSSLYDFELPKCYEYVREHMNECLENEGFLTITKASVETLFTDETLAYVSSDAKFTFFISYAKHIGKCRYEDFLSILQLIDLNDVSINLVEDAKADPFFANYEHNFDMTADVPGLLHEVLVMRAPTGSATFWVLDLHKQAWFRLDSHQGNRSHSDQRFFSRRINDGIVHSIRANYDGTVIHIYDFVRHDTVTTTALFDEHGNEKFEYAKVSCFCETAYAMITKTVSKYLQSKTATHGNISLADLQRLRLLGILGASVSISDSVAMATLCRSRKQNTEISVLYMGQINSSGENTCMMPILSLPFKIQGELCANEANILAFFGDADYLHLFDANAFTLDTLYVKNPYGSKLRPTDSGFVVYNSSCISCILKSRDASLPLRYQVKRLDLEPADRKSKRYNYFYVENTWFRDTEMYDQDDEFLEYISHDELMSSKSVAKAAWKPLPTAKFYSRFSVIEGAVKISLPKSKLRCHINCPHCERIKREEERGRYSGYEHDRFFTPAWITYDDDDSEDDTFGYYDHYQYPDYYDSDSSDY